MEVGLMPEDSREQVSEVANDTVSASPASATAEGDDWVAALNTRIRQELLSTRRGGFARVKTVHGGGDRVTVALKQAPETIYSKIPVLVPYAAPDDTGDSLPLVEGDSEGLVMVVHDPVRDLLSTRGSRPDQRFARSLASQCPVFLPAQPHFNDETPRDVAPDERVVGHPSGSKIRIQPNGDIRLEHADGPTLAVTADGIAHTTTDD